MFGRAFISCFHSFRCEFLLHVQYLAEAITSVSWICFGGCVNIFVCALLSLLVGKVMAN